MAALFFFLLAPIFMQEFGRTTPAEFGSSRFHSFVLAAAFGYYVFEFIIALFTTAVYTGSHHYLLVVRAVVALAVLVPVVFCPGLTAPLLARLPDVLQWPLLTLTWLIHVDICTWFGISGLYFAANG